ncbi:MAG: polysaccharide pyruvyl transferase family protein [Hyphomicrobiales bacterium]|nr:polysaccharide pyruvyl transferase family protein [Hyphomicrobiales bacterium]
MSERRLKDLKILDGDRSAHGTASKAARKRLPSRVFLYNASIQYENLGDLTINKHLFESLRQHGHIRFNTKNSSSPLPGSGVGKLGTGPSDGNYESYFSKMGIEPHEILADGLWGFVKIILNNSPLNLFRSSRDKLKVYLVFTPGGISGNLTLGVLARTAFLTLATCLGAKSARFGVSIGPFSRPRERIERFQARCLTVNTVRDSQSEAYARQIGMRDTRHFPDFGFLLKRNAETPNPLPAAGPYVVISLRNDNLSSQQVQRMLEWLGRCVEQVSSEKTLTLVFSWQVDRDADLMRTLAAHYNERFPVHIFERWHDQAELFAIYRDAAFLITNRLHVFLFAASQGSIPFAAVTDPANRKLTGLIRDLELDHLIYDYTDQPSTVPTWPQIEGFSTITRNKIGRAFDSAATSIHQELTAIFQNDN